MSLQLRGFRCFHTRLSTCSSHHLHQSISQARVFVPGSLTASSHPLKTPAQVRLCSQHSKPPVQPTTLPQQALAYSTTSTNNKPASAPSASTIHDFVDPKNTKMSDKGEEKYSVVFESNSKWRRSLAESHPGLFDKLSKGQQPEILWIGCADSRCPETTILGLQPGDIFCHRNIANILIPTDLNSLSVIEYAVRYLKVKHIIVCGHTSCGGVAAALDNKRLGAIDTWLLPLRHIRARNAEMLNALPETERALKLVDLNVRNSVDVLLENPVVVDAMDERGLEVHGLIYNIGTGELNELDIPQDEPTMKAKIAAFKIA